MCPCMRAHWRHLENMMELVLPSAHPSPQPKRQIDEFSRFCTAHGRKCLYFTMGDPYPQNCPFSLGLRPPSISWYLEADRAHNPNWSRSVQLFSPGDRRVSLYFTMGRTFSSSKLPLPMGGSGHSSNNGSLGPTESSSQIASWPVQPF